MRTRVVSLIAVMLSSGLSGCSRAPGKVQGEAEPEARTQLIASLAKRDDIALAWTYAGPAPAGFVVEFATEPDGQYTIIQFVPPGQTRFTHPEVIPDTDFYYRIRPYYGPASAAVDMSMPDAPSGEDVDKMDHAWAYPQTLPEGIAKIQQTVRTGTASAAAAPVNLKGTIMHSKGIRFTWVDRASDEEGFFVEVKAAGRPDFAVVAVVDPNINSYGVMTLPEERRAAFRVRAYYYGKPSNVAHQKSLPDTAPAAQSKG